MNLRWILNRVRTMGARELRHRGAQYLRAQAERAGFGWVKSLPADATRGKPWIAAWPEGFAIATYREAAERILRGRFRLFGNRDWMLGFPPDWNRDPSSGRLAPLAFGKTLDYRDQSLVGSIKYLWEPNRHLELVTLAQAWRLTGEARFAQGCRTLVGSWIASCPYMMGPNWTSSLELALRLINWSCAWQLLGGDQSMLFQDQQGSAFKAHWLAAVRQHCHFIAGHLSLHSSANNHLLGELLGLLIGSTTWPCWPESARWRGRALQGFREQALLQNNVDGVNKEQAIWYQHEVADMMLLAGLTAAANGCDFGEPFWRRLEAMLDFIASCMDVAGHVPALGDADDAVMVRFSPVRDFRAYQSLLATGSVLFGRGDFKHKAQVFDDKSRWLLGDAAAAKFAALAPDSSGQRLRRCFEAGGYYILGSDFETPREVRLIVDAAPLGYLAIAAHGHADALSFTLSVAGRPMLIDPGTYSYDAHSRWRDYFRGTSAHNTVAIDNLDQSVPGGAFLWSRHASARCLLFAPGADQERIVAEHDGYRRLHDPVVHRREILYQRAAQVITVTDHILCASEHYVEIFWHFAEACRVTLDGDTARATRDGVGMLLRWPAPLHGQLVRGSVDPIQGWISQGFDEKAAADTLMVSGSVTGDWKGASTIELSLP
ncbi:MAG TPA: alginate lyase family protein [Steroidobacteraceae bacterium]|jgi:Heparinase II/III-like protein/Heparinase II/III N-terminus|nr:alginate lyase family protein [Steroidobacteraceae bacterium]